MLIRTATMKDLDIITEVETECFPPAEAATRADFRNRLAHYPNHFWLLFDEGKLISFIDGFCTDEKDLRDEMYENASLHRSGGQWQMIFGVNTIPDYRRRGYAGILMRRVIQDARAQGRKGLVLTCKEEKIHWYERFGYVNEGVSPSVHGNVVWYQMRITF